MLRADNLTTFMCQMSWNLGASTSWKPLGLPRPVMGLLYSVQRYDTMCVYQTTWCCNILEDIFLSFFYVLLTLHHNIMIVFFLPTWCTNSLFQYIYYIPLHVSSTIVLIFRRTFVLTQHLVSSLSLGDCSVHRLQEHSCNSCYGPRQTTGIN